MVALVGSVRCVWCLVARVVCRLLAISSCCCSPASTHALTARPCCCWPITASPLPAAAAVNVAAGYLELAATCHTWPRATTKLLLNNNSTKVTGATAVGTAVERLFLMWPSPGLPPVLGWLELVEAHGWLFLLLQLLPWLVLLVRWCW